ncbi:hypothetical protein FACS1894158_16930 [Betaproteobacteria bacterium]|nr:hypothetical protein FACS1894158_16930 [Betaproteobacteria bacterium]
MGFPGERKPVAETIKEKAEAERAALSAKSEKSEKPVTKERAASAAKTENPKIIEGKLIEHGAAPYQHDKKNQPSYFVKVRDENGYEKTRIKHQDASNVEFFNRIRPLPPLGRLPSYGSNATGC